MSSYFMGASVRKRIAVLAEYLPILIFLVVATGIGLALILIGRSSVRIALIPKSSPHMSVGFRLLKTHG